MFSEAVFVLRVLFSSSEIDAKFKCGRASYTPELVHLAFNSIAERMIDPALSDNIIVDTQGPDFRNRVVTNKLPAELLGDLPLVRIYFINKGRC